MLLLTAIAAAQKAGKKEQEPAEPPAAKTLPEARALPDEVKSGPGAPVDPKTYRLGPEDVILVRVWRENDLSGAMLVRPDGKITMPLVGEIQAAGETPEQLTKNIVAALEKVMTKPEVTVSVQQVNSRKFAVIGEVMKPGTYPLVVATTVMDALSLASGLREFANGKKIVIIRGDERLKFNYNDFVKGKNLKQNIVLENGDQIVVP
jgi:polysaccharide export outer membrane protein